MGHRSSKLSSKNESFDVMIDRMDDFIEEHCILDPAAFVPITLLNLAWIEYAKMHGFYDDLKKYDCIFVKPLGVRADQISGCYLGMTLDTYPTISSP
jgi:hypothetical protein